MLPDKDWIFFWRFRAAEPAFAPAGAIFAKDSTTLTTLLFNFGALESD